MNFINIHTYNPDNKYNILKRTDRQPIMSGKSKDQGQLYNLEKAYQLSVKKELSTLQALYEILQPKKPIKKIKEGLQFLKRNEKSVQQLKWRQKKNKAEFIKLCESLQKYFDEERERSMRSTEKNISEMNQQVSRMRKSLSEKGILLHFKDEDMNKEENIMNRKSQTQRQNKIQTNIENKQTTAKKLLDNQIEEKNEYENEERSDVNEKKQYITDQTNGEGLSQQPQQKTNNNQTIDPNPEDDPKKWEYGSEKQKKGNGIEQDNAKAERVLQIKRLKIQSHVTETSISNNSPTDRQKNLIIQTLKKHKEPIQWIEIGNPGYPIVSLESKNQMKKLKTLPQELDNEFYDQQLSQLKESRKERYNPKIQIGKKLGKIKQSYPSPKNQLQQVFYKTKKKLSQLFSHFLKGLKTNNFTFDAMPQSLDIRTFSSHFQHFKLNEFVKVVDIPKLFKRYSNNGTWLNEEGFFMIHLKIFGMPENVEEQIISLTEKLEKLEQSYILINTSDAQQEEKNVQIKNIEKQKGLVQNRSSSLLEKINKANMTFPQSEIKRLTRKIEKKSQSFDKIKDQYDLSRLKKIVQTHSGIYKQDIIQRLGERKRQNEIKHQVNMQKILQKYKGQNMQPSSEGNSRSSVNKSNQSTPNLHRIQGYSKRNILRKFGQPVSDLLSHCGLPKESNSNQINLPKSKAYYKPPQQKRLGNEVKREGISISGGSTQKSELLKQLSLPKLPKRKLRQQSIYESLRLIDAKAQLEFIKKLVSSGNKDEEEKIFEEFYLKERQILDKEKWKKATIQNSMKFS